MVNKQAQYRIFSMSMLRGIILILCVALLIFLTDRSFGFSLSTALIDSSSLFIVSIVFVYFIYTIQQFYHPKNIVNIPNTSISVFFSLIALIFNYFISHWSYNSTDSTYPDYYMSTLWFRSAIVLLSMIICLIFFWIDQQRVTELKRKQLLIEQERESVKIELNSLQQQFKPHFLFNSLNSINALTLSSPEEARKMVHLLSEFMRGQIKTDPSASSTFEEEINHIKLYMDIEKVRFGDRLNVSFDIDDDCLGCQVPSLILQPIIENAVKYGLYGHTDAVEIKITANIVNHHLEVVIQNPFDPTTQTSVKGTGFGLGSIEKKLMILYKQSNLLTTNANNAIFTTTLKIPCHV